MLEVYIPPADYMLALKVLAGRPQDLPDIRALIQVLHVATRQQAQQILDRYIDPAIQTANQVTTTLGILFP